jgi:hypothetical protein
MKMIGKVPPLLTWHIFQIIVDSIGPIVFVYILNQYKGCWLLNDALNVSISMSLKFKDEVDCVTFNNLMEEDVNVVFEFSCLPSNIKKKVIEVLDSFFFLLEEI